jgi:hypothetical protein
MHSVTPPSLDDLVAAEQVLANSGDNSFTFRLTRFDLLPEANDGRIE